MSNIDSTNFREIARQVIEKYKEGDKLIDVLVWNTIVGLYEAAHVESERQLRAKCDEVGVLLESEALACERGNRLAGQVQDLTAWGVYVVTGPSADEWCEHTLSAGDNRIRVDERTARTIALLFTERFQHMFKYEARRLT